MMIENTQYVGRKQTGGGGFSSGVRVGILNEQEQPKSSQTSREINRTTEKDRSTDNSSSQGLRSWIECVPPRGLRVRRCDTPLDLGWIANADAVRWLRLCQHHS